METKRVFSLKLNEEHMGKQASLTAARLDSPSDFSPTPLAKALHGKINLLAFQSAFCPSQRLPSVKHDGGSYQQTGPEQPEGKSCSLKAFKCCYIFKTTYWRGELFPTPPSPEAQPLRLPGNLSRKHVANSNCATETSRPVLRQEMVSARSYVGRGGMGKLIGLHVLVWGTAWLLGHLGGGLCSQLGGGGSRGWSELETRVRWGWVLLTLKTVPWEDTASALGELLPIWWAHDVFRQ